MSRPARVSVTTVATAIALFAVGDLVAAGPGTAAGWGAVSLGAAEQASPDPDVVRVAYPDEPAPWYPRDATGTAATDLAALWGLPLYRVDSHGQLRPALAERATITPGEPGEPWVVEVELGEGSWSDGSPVTSVDVAATLRALRDAGIDVGPLESVQATDPRTVELAFARPYARWPYLLAGGGSVLPAHVLADGGLEAFRDDVPVSGGPYELASWEPGLRATFVANPQSPLGAPSIGAVEVWFVAGFETALGLLDADRIDLLTGYLAVDPEPRVEELSGANLEATLGGTWALLAWSGAPVDARRAVGDAIGLDEVAEAMFQGLGVPATSTVPGVEGPWNPAGGVSGVALRESPLAIVVPKGQEATTLLGRAIDRQLRASGADVTLVTGDDVARLEGDAHLVVRRDVAWPGLAGRAGEDADPTLVARLADADGAATRSSPAALDAQIALRDAAVEIPLLRLAVTTVWRSGLDGVAASSWPGTALWNAADWQWQTRD